MALSSTQRVLAKNRYIPSLPLPISAPLKHYYTSLSKDNAIRAKELTQSVESAIRYSAIVGICDYATNPGVNESVLMFLRDTCFDKAKPSLRLGDWSEILLKVLDERNKTWADPFVEEFKRINAEDLKAEFVPFLSFWDSVETNARFIPPMKYLHFAAEHEKHLFNILEHFYFLSHYWLCCLEEMRSDEVLLPGSGQVVNVFHGDDIRPQKALLRPHQPIRLNGPFILNKDLSRILTLHPFLQYAVVSTLPEMDAKKPKPSVVADLEGLFLFNSIQSSDSYCSADMQAMVSLDAFEYPYPIEIQRQLNASLISDSGYPLRLDLSIDERDKKRFCHRPGYVTSGTTFEGDKNVYTVIDQPIGRGGMGIVYLVERERDKKLLTLKAIPAGMLNIGALPLRFEREARLLIELAKENNPNIVKAFDKGENNDYQFLVMEHVEGGSLADQLQKRSKKRPPYDFEEALQIIRQICNGIATIHAKKIVHRDLKPGNIMLAPQLDENGSICSVVPKVMDFGLARHIGEQSIVLTQEQEAIGTFEFMSPEQRGDKRCVIDQRADVYAMGKILAQMLTGTVPKNAEEVESLDFAPLKESFRPLEAKHQPGNKNVPKKAFGFEENLSERPYFDAPIEGIKLILTCCLAKDPEDRFDAITGPNSFLDALEKAKLVDDSEPVLRDLGITHQDVRAAYGMARIGHTKARKRLLSWCSQEMGERHEQAAIALSQLDEGLQEIINKAKRLHLNKNEKELHNIVHTLSCILRQEENKFPRTYGQKWLSELDGNLPKRVKKAYISDNLQRFKSSWLAIFTRYAIFSALFSAIGSLPSTAIGGNVLYRTYPANTGYFIRFPGFFFGCMMSGILWGGLFPLAYHFGRTYERPRRFMMTFFACCAAFCFSTIAIIAFMQTQGKGVIAEELGQRNAIILITQYFAILSLLCSIPFLLYFLVKETTTIQNKLPSFFLSVFIMPLTVMLFSVLTILLFTERGFLRLELWGELLIILGAAIGTGLADWWLDIRNKQSVIFDEID